ncbi:MAG: radical SAM protein [Deltaproteobacteria bacterium]|jgi:DNA repair photolyase|nr:radical SAM protein [Deltaproteobacteria bacterium]
MIVHLSRPASRILTPTGGFLRAFTHSLNPYVGCAFGRGGGCPFCYVRKLAVAGALAAPWGQWVIAKSNLPELLEKELFALQRGGSLAGMRVFMSSATDPYQGLERRLGLSRAALELFARFGSGRLVVQTRSPLIERDVDLLRALGRRVIVSLTVETDDERVRRALTPTSPPVASRLQAAGRLRGAGIFVQLAIAPMLPNDAERFAELVLPVCDRVVVDTYFDGDGSAGARSRALGIEALYRELGYADWFRRGAEAQLLAALGRRLGPSRVLFSCEGFNAPWPREQP